MATQPPDDAYSSQAIEKSTLPALSSLRLSPQPDRPSPGPDGHAGSLSLDDASSRAKNGSGVAGRIRYRPYKGEEDVPSIMQLVDTELSEAYNFYTYRYFLRDWPNLCFMAFDGNQPVGTIVCKQDRHRDALNRGYLAMLSTRPSHRGRGIATHLLRLSLTAMLVSDPPADEVVLETETDNTDALRFYERMGFIKEKRLYRFYMNSKDAFRLFLPLGGQPGVKVREEWTRLGGGNNLTLLEDHYAD